MTVHRQIQLASETDFEGWRAAARTLLVEGAPPQWVHFGVDGGQNDLFNPSSSGEAERSAARTRGPSSPALDAPLARPAPNVDGPAAGSSGLRSTSGSAPPEDDGLNGPSAVAKTTVPRSFLDLAETVALHRDPERFDRLYRVLWRLQSDRNLMSVTTDADIAQLNAMAKAIRRDIHKMRAFVRFREIVPEPGAEPVHVAWFEPEHHIVERNAAFFVRRFAGMRWSILTPERSVMWDGQALTFGPGARKEDAPAFDEMEELWRSYYASIFNPARLKVNAMRSEMPQKYWKNLPEAALIPELVGGAQRRMEAMVAEPPSTPLRKPMRAEPRPIAVPANDYEAVRAAAADCRACPLWAPATQTVFGEGPIDADVMLVGEQPGDQEDLAGHPFVGPAGKVLDRALAEADIERDRVYVTNAVKHFKFVPRGKIRLHQRPSGGEVKACGQWFEKEVAIIRPKLVVALGATAASQVFGKSVTIGGTRGRLIDWGDSQALVTVHPSYLLRLPDQAAKDVEYAKFVADLRLATPLLKAA